METSKKIISYLGICFGITLLYGIIIFTSSFVTGKSCDFTLPITLISVTGGIFGGAVVFYYSKAKVENIYKIKKSFLKEKYAILKKSGMLTQDYIQEEIMGEVQSIDAKLDSEEESALSSAETNFNINL